MTANLRLVPFNLLDPVTLTITSEESGYGKERLAFAGPSLTWRSTSAVAQTITADLGDDYLVDSFCAVNHNFSPTGEIQLEVATDAGYSNLVVNETFDAALPLYGLGDGWLGQGGLGGFGDALYHQTLRPYFFTGGVGRYVRITITDTSNADGYVEAGRIIVASSWQPTVNHNWGIGKYIDPGTRETKRTPAASARTAPGEPFKVIRVGFTWLEEDEEFALERILLAYGNKVGTLLVPYPEAATIRQTSFAVYGVLRNWTQSIRQQTRKYGIGFDVEESK